jgi:hypothetical protein
MTRRREIGVVTAHLKAAHGIRTHFSPYNDSPWMAVAPFDANDPRDLAAIMAQECRLLDEAGRVFEARTQLLAVRGLIRLLEGNAG